MNRIIKLLIITILLSLCTFRVEGKQDTLKVLQLNLWVLGENVPDGLKGIVDIIDQTDPDIALFCEIAGHNEEQSCH